METTLSGQSASKTLAPTKQSFITGHERDLERVTKLANQHRSFRGRTTTTVHAREAGITFQHVDCHRFPNHHYSVMKPPQVTTEKALPSLTLCQKMPPVERPFISKR